MEELPEPSGTGSVVLNIGGDAGAAVITTPASLAKSEIEIRRSGSRWDGTHVAVRARLLVDGVVHAAVFESLTQGDYEVRVRGGSEDEPLAAFVVKGGRVTTAQLREEAGADASPSRPWTARQPNAWVPEIHP